MTLFVGWHGVKTEFIRDGVKGLHSDWGDYKAWQIPLKMRANVYVDGIWNGAILRVRLAHSHNLHEWFSIEGGEFLPISHCGNQTIEFIQPSRFNRIEYWLENVDKFSYIRIYVEIVPQENPFGWPPESEDGLLDSREIMELYVTGEGIPASLTMLGKE